MPFASWVSLHLKSLSFLSKCWSTTERGASPTSGALIIMDNSFTELHLQSHSADTHCPANGWVESNQASHGISKHSVPPGLSLLSMLKMLAAPASDPKSSAKGTPSLPCAPQDSNFFTAKRAVEGQSLLVSRWLSTRSNTVSMVCRPTSSEMISVTGSHSAGPVSHHLPACSKEEQSERSTRKAASQQRSGTWWLESLGEFQGCHTEQPSW